MPNWKQEILKRLAGLKLAPAREAEIAEELAQHLEDRYQELAAGGATEDEARRLALAELGGGSDSTGSGPSADGSSIAAFKKTGGEDAAATASSAVPHPDPSGQNLLARGLRRVEQEAPQEPIVLGSGGGHNFLESTLQDIRYGLRQLRRNPGFTAVAVLTLALGIGANTAVFSLIDGLLLRLLPVKHPEQLVFIDRLLPKGRTADDFGYPVFQQFRDESHSFSGMFAWDGSSVSVTVDGQAELVAGDFVSGNYFDVLGVGVIVGRTFTADDDQLGKKPVAVISYSYWQRRFARDASVVGKVIDLGGIPFTVIGVTSPRFFGRNVAGRTADIVVPMFTHPQLGLKDHNTFEIMARLKPGVSPEQARADLDAIYHQALTQAAGSHLSPRVEREIRAQRVELKPGLRGTSGLNEEFGTELRILMTVVGITLLIACLNVASLMLARATSRQKEIAVRLAIGAGRKRVICQLLTESVLLAAVGGILGSLLAEWGVGALATVLTYGRGPISVDFKPEVGVLVFTSAISVLTGMLFGLAPALAATRVDLNAFMKGSGGETRSRSLRHDLGNSMVVSQVALSLTLLVGAGLLVRSLRQLYHVDTGFNRDNVLVGWVFPVLAGYDHTKEMSLYRELLEKLNTIPGVRSASLSRYRLLFARPNRDLWVPGSAPASDADREVYCYPVSSGFFETEGIRLELGRGVLAADTETSPKVAVISESVARQFFANQNPMGRRLGFGRPEVSGDFEIVGVAKDIQPHLRGPQPLRAVYIPYTQAFPDDYGQMTFAIRTTLEASSIIPAVRHQIQGIDKDLAVSDVKTQAADADETLGDEKSLATLLSLFGALALALAAMGLYGTLSYRAARSTKEIGIRMALGAQRSDVLRMVVGQGLRLTLIGVVIGTIGAFLLTRFLSSLLYGVKPTDPLTFISVSLLLVLVALVASYVPARRATKVDPMVALRYE